MVRIIQTVMASVVVVTIFFFSSPSNAQTGGEQVYTMECALNEIYCAPKFIPPAKSTDADCLTNPNRVFIVNPFGQSHCVDNLDEARVLSRQTQPTPRQEQTIKSTSDPYVAMTGQLAANIFEQVLGGKKAVAEPTVDCDTAQGAAAVYCAKRTDYFKSFYSNVRKIALFLIAPFFMLMIIQAILKGSLKIVIESTFIKLPLALIFTAMLTVFVQQIVNISDDLTNYISYKTVTEQIVNCANGDATAAPTQISQGNIGEIYGNCYKNAINAKAVERMGFMVLLLAPILLIAIIVIEIELLLRQMGVMAITLFLPIAFAAMIWPTAYRAARMMIEVLMMFIFSKVVLAAALSLGLALMADMADSQSLASVSNAASTTIGDGTAIDTAGLSAWHTYFIAVIVIVLAAVAQTKILTMTGASIIKQQGLMYSPRNLYNYGFGTYTILKGAKWTAEKFAKRRNAGEGFSKGKGQSPFVNRNPIPKKPGAANTFGGKTPGNPWGAQKPKHKDQSNTYGKSNWKPPNSRSNNKPVNKPPEKKN